MNLQSWSKLHVGTLVDAIDSYATLSPPPFSPLPPYNVVFQVQSAADNIVYGAAKGAEGSLRDNTPLKKKVNEID